MARVAGSASSADDGASQDGGIVAALAALGIVYGDLGTSPLYTYQAILHVSGGHPSADDALGLLSLVVWALIITISIKYCLFVMRADNHGEGGILALMSLVTGPQVTIGRSAGIWTFIGLFGAALIYGDGVITPSISVLSALEGVNVVTRVFRPYVVPAALLVLLILFATQSRGTARIGRTFGPVMLVWFAAIGILGFRGIVQRPQVIMALDPRQAITFLARHGWPSLVVLGGVFLAITGGEALYADMGHIGRKPIRTIWYCIVLPALLFSYAGQTGLLLEDPSNDGNPFFVLSPPWAAVPMVILATLATIIASQAIITGAFSLTRQAMQLGWLPGLDIRQTSDVEYGQIYVPFVNWAMMIGTLILTYHFGSSARLAGAYGTAVSATMLLTTALLCKVMQDVWLWPRLLALIASGAFLLVDTAFFAANLLKIPDGGWIPFLFSIVIFVVMVTWHEGMQVLRRQVGTIAESTDAFLSNLRSGHVSRVPGTVVFLSRSGTPVPPVMIRHVAQMKALQEIAISLTVRFEKVPRVAEARRATVEPVGDGIWHIIVHFGFIEIPNLSIALTAAKGQGCPLVLDDAIYIAARDAVVRRTMRPRLPTWRRVLFSFMYRNAVRTPDRFDLPPDAFLEIQRQVEV